MNNPFINTSITLTHIDERDNDNIELDQSNIINYYNDLIDCMSCHHFFLETYMSLLFLLVFLGSESNSFLTLMVQFLGLVLMPFSFSSFLVNPTDFILPRIGN